jgi:hypothetical protein
LEINQDLSVIFKTALQYPGPIKIQKDITLEDKSIMSVGFHYAPGEEQSYNFTKNEETKPK